jgi:hypothetical protein
VPASTAGGNSSAPSAPTVASSVDSAAATVGFDPRELGRALLLSEKLRLIEWPLLVALLALAIVLLGLPSAPRIALPESRTSDLLARHRIEIAGLGAAAFGAVVIGFLLG